MQVDLAEPFDPDVEIPLDTGFSRNVGLDRDRRCRQRSDGARYRVAVDVDGDDLGALGGQALCGRPADAAPGAGHDRDEPVEPGRDHRSLRCGPRVVRGAIDGRQLPGGDVDQPSLDLCRGPI